MTLDSGEQLFSRHIVLAVGHSARDTFQMLLEQGVYIEAKPFSIGFRIEHPQSVIDREAPTFGVYRQARPGATFSVTQNEDYRHPPLLGEHGSEILRELGYDAARIAEIRADGVIR